MTRIGLIAAAALLVGTFGVAGAQTATSPSTSTSVNQGKCWDSALNKVRDKSAGTTSSSGSSTSGTSSALPSTGSSSGTATTAQTRPPGMPNC